MVNEFFQNINKRSTRFEGIEVDAKISTKKKVVKIEKTSKGTKIEVLKK